MKKKKKISTWNAICLISIVCITSAFAGLGMDIWYSSFGYPIDTFMACVFAGLVSMVFTLLIIKTLINKDNKE